MLFTSDKNSALGREDFEEDATFLYTLYASLMMPLCLSCAERIGTRMRKVFRKSRKTLTED